MEVKKREVGFYWVTGSSLLWAVAHWNGTAWLYPGNDLEYDDKDFQEIDERQVFRQVVLAEDKLGGMEGGNPKAPKPLRRYFMFGASYKTIEGIGMGNFYCISDKGFPKETDCVEVVNSRIPTLGNISILSICELSKEDYETFFNFK